LSLNVDEKAVEFEANYSTTIFLNNFCFFTATCLCLQSSRLYSSLEPASGVVTEGGTAFF